MDRLNLLRNDCLRFLFSPKPKTEAPRPCSCGRLELVRERLRALKVLRTGVVVGAAGVELSQSRNVGEPGVAEVAALILVSNRRRPGLEADDVGVWLTGARER